ncbi:MAG: VWA domain-containing protein [Candidatus Cloacimonetes bacterium]|nr:VWA domain-containing protein [Candidatus Cloacimonadota bacterium]
MMKKLTLFMFFCSAVVILSAAGVLVNRDNTTFQITHLNECSYEVNVNNQVAEVQVLNRFTNTSLSPISPRLYFPLPTGASPTSLRWAIGEQWHEASIAGVQENPQGGPSTFPHDFVDYILLMPLVFDIPEDLLVNESLSIELTYVQMLNYNFGSVSLNLKNNYSSMQTSPLDVQSLDIDIVADKVIEGFEILDVNEQSSHTDHTATAHYHLYNSPATTNYRCVIHLSTSELSSWGLSTYLENAPDDGDQGFFLYTFEENAIPSNQNPNIRLNIVIDASGSMTWEDRLIHAKTAACWLINNLEQGDYFNVIFFDHLVRPLWGNMRAFDDANRILALSYVQNYEMPGLNGTNLSGALYTALSQLGPGNTPETNCVLLLSDGQPTVGATDTYNILRYVSIYASSDPHIYCFGIGSEVNYQLLNSLAQNYNGISIFLESSEIVNTITSFYNEMRNPITLNPLISTSAGTSDVLPDPFPAIYGGMQYRLVGRYSDLQGITIGISGNHQDTPVNYTYNYTLADTETPNMGFIPKIWAATKIDNLLIEYYSHHPQSQTALALKQQIIDLSIDFGVICVFTNFSSDPPAPNADETQDLIPIPLKLLQNYPNPFNPSTTISFEVLSDLQEDAEIRIYNLKGQLIYLSQIPVHGKGLYEFVWLGTDMQNQAVSSGVYIYSIRCGKYILHNRMTLSK